VPSVPAGASRAALLKDLHTLEEQLAQVLAGSDPKGDSAEVMQRLCNGYNHTAMQLLEVDDIGGAMELLEKAQASTRIYQCHPKVT
jgi:hypothetical protein